VISIGHCEDFFVEGMFAWRRGEGSFEKKGGGEKAEPAVGPRRVVPSGVARGKRERLTAL